MKRSGRGSGGIKEWQLERAGEASAEGEETLSGIVINVSRGRCTVAAGRKLLEAWMSRRSAPVVVGDHVKLERSGRDVWLREIEPRTALLSRRDPGGEGEKLIAANVDVVVLVVTYREPPLKPGLIDRYLAATTRGGCSLLVCVNKSDLLSDEDREEALRELSLYRSIGVDIFFTSATTGEGIASVRERIEGGTSVLSGHSGVGKSSLINALRPELALRTNTLHRAMTAGRHTTTSSTLYRLNDATAIIDTPGIREFALGRIDRETLLAAFPDLTEHTACRFNDCSHRHEPDCGVRDALAAGRLDARRYEAYLKLADGEE